MEVPLSMVVGWPSLMSQETAARYLCLDVAAFVEFAARHSVSPVDLKLDVVRWRKADIDALVRHLPRRNVPTASYSMTKSGIDDAAVERIAEAVVKHLSRDPVPSAAMLVSIREAVKMLGLGRSTLYAMIAAGQLSTRRIGRRNLVPRTEIDRLLSGRGET